MLNLNLNPKPKTMKRKLSAEEIKKSQDYHGEPEWFEEAVQFGEWVVGKYGDMTNCNNGRKIITFIPAYEYAKYLTETPTKNP